MISGHHHHHQTIMDHVVYHDRSYSYDHYDLAYGYECDNCNTGFPAFHPQGFATPTTDGNCTHNNTSDRNSASANLYGPASGLKILQSCGNNSSVQYHENHSKPQHTQLKYSATLCQEHTRPFTQKGYAPKTPTTCNNLYKHYTGDFTQKQADLDKNR